MGAGFGLGRGAGGDPPEDVQPVAELAFLHVADEAVDPCDRLGQRRRSIQPQIGLHPRRRRLGADIGLQAVAAARIKAISIGKLIQQPFQPCQPLGRAAGAQRRGDMTQRQCPDAALGLRGLARIVDDEGVDHRQITGQRLGPAFIRQGHSLARQPFQRAMRADMHQRLRAEFLPQPEVEGDIAMARGA